MNDAVCEYARFVVLFVVISCAILCNTSSTPSNVLMSLYLLINIVPVVPTHPCQSASRGHPTN